MPKFKIEVLDNGYLELVDFMGADEAVIRAARRCYLSEPQGKDADARLIRHLILKDHGTPFEHAYFTFDVKCPIFVARQWMRHRIGSYDEMSLRYCLAKRDYYTPADLTGEALDKYKRSIEAAFDSYETLVGSGVKREQARGVLPLSVYTLYYWTVNARSLMNFLKLRLDKAAQAEIREYAKAALRIFKEKMPVAAKAFEEKLKPKE
ncbi:MAG: FAD-dependent thymidylate synthase [Candidatus Omnitrophota bacterium]